MATDGTRVCNTKEENEVEIVNVDDVDTVGGLTAVHVPGDSPSKTLIVA